MKKLFLGLMILPMMVTAQTLEECQQAAERNYPLIRQYGLIEKTTELTVANIQKGWLPQVSASAQATYQSDVVAIRVMSLPFQNRCRPFISRWDST